MNNLKIKDNKWDQLIQNISNTEIWNALRRIGSDKAPGTDGLNACFFKTYWRLVEPHVGNLIGNFFQNNIIQNPP